MTETKPGKDDAERRRLEAALRENLRRRKEQQRARAERDGGEEPAEGEKP
jgi:hypothetical protein